MTRAGNVAVVGKPNVGKSTLLNALVGQKLSITSPKPQSTRDRIVGIVSRGDAQFILLDTPGLLVPRYALHESMRAAALRALDDADVILYVCDATEGTASPIETAAALGTPPRAPVVKLYNKVDAVSPDVRDILSRTEPTAAFASALTGEGTTELLDRLAIALPEGPFLYDPDDASAQQLRFFAAEFVRECALEQLADEVPYAIACSIEEFREESLPVYIRAVLYVERESQKGILIGKKGARIRALGEAARHKIEPLVGTSVYLDLHVKVLPNWRRDPAALKRLGFSTPEARRT